MTAFADLGETRTAFDVEGVGPPLLLIHGAEATRESFAALAQALAPHATVVRHDQRECGETTSDGRPHRIPDLAEDAAQLMAFLGHARYAVMGTSLGGRVAQALALAHPERVSKLVLCNTWPLDRLLGELNPEGVARLAALRAGLPDTARAMAEMFYTPAHVEAHPALEQRFARPPTTSRRGALALEVHALPDAGITCDTLCLSGTEDRVATPEAMRALANRLPHASWQVMEGVGHSAAVQAPALLARLIADALHGTH